MKITLRFGAVAVLVATLLVPATAASAADPQPPCVHRICLVVVDPDADTDGDGYPDVDERELGSDPYDPSSVPPPELVIDLAILGKLPSFENHFSEIVVFPQLTSELDAYATALGRIPLPGKGWKDMSLASSLEQLHANGLTSVESIMALTTPRAEAPVKPGSNTWVGYLGLVAAGSWSTTTWSIEGTHISGQGTTQNGNGSYEVVRGTVTASGQLTTTEYDAAGKVAGTTTVSGSHYHDQEDLSGDTSVTVVTEGKDADGKPIKVTTHVETKVKDGTRTQTVHIVVEQNGETVMDETAETTTDCPNNACDAEYSDPDYQQVVLTPADYARVAAKLDSIRTPGPDDGRLDVGTLEVPDRDIYALYSGDGIVVLSAAPATFNRAQPEYDPYLRDRAPHAGTRFPLDGTDPYGRPGDEP